MSNGKTPNPEAPFGYTFPSDPNNSSSSYYPPAGPPLLDNTETDLLKNFFDNPNNVDPSFLSLPNDYQGNGSGGGSYSDMNFDWTNGGSQNFMNAASGPAQDGQRYNDNGVFGSRSGQQASAPPSDDVYAAAQLLHNNHIRQNGPYPQSSVQTQGMGMQGVGTSAAYDYQQPIPASSYDFSSNNPMMNGFYGNNVSSGYAGDASRNAFMQGVPGVVNGWGSDSRGRPLRFGSDENFQSANYIPASSEAPDKELEEAVTQHIQYNLELQTKSKSTQPSSPEDSPRKRGRHSQRFEYSDAESESSEDDSIGRKRRKSKIFAENGHDSSGRNRRKSGQKATPQAQSSKSRKHSTVSNSNTKSKRSKEAQAASAKAARENLTEEQKRSNHIQSEQKRRNLIKQGFESLNQLVPELRSGGFSKSNMLLEVARFMRQMENENEELRAVMNSLDNG